MLTQVPANEARALQLASVPLVSAVLPTSTATGTTTSNNVQSANLAGVLSQVPALVAPSTPDASTATLGTADPNVLIDFVNGILQSRGLLGIDTTSVTGSLSSLAGQAGDLPNLLTP